VKATIDKDKIQLDLYELIDEIDPETKEEIISAFAWQSPIWNEIKRQFCESYAAENMNHKIHELRLLFFQDGNAPEALRQTIKSLLDVIKHLRAKEQAASSTNGKWRKWYGDNMPAHRQPVPFPRYELEWTPNWKVREFLEHNGLDDILPTGTQE
jgi:hypothetical protein